MPKVSRQTRILDWKTLIWTREVRRLLFCAVSDYQVKCLFCTRNRSFPALGDQGLVRVGCGSWGLRRRHETAARLGLPGSPISGHWPIEDLGHSNVSYTLSTDVECCLRSLRGYHSACVSIRSIKDFDREAHSFGVNARLSP
jgi:hypothetical protein